MALWRRAQRRLPPPKLFVGLAGVYHVEQHFRFEAARDLSLISTMRHAVGGEASFDDQSPAVLAQRAALAGCDSARFKPPTLLMHYENDGVVPWAQSAAYDLALVRGELAPFARTHPASRPTLVRQSGTECPPLYRVSEREETAQKQQRRLGRDSTTRMKEGARRGHKQSEAGTRSALLLYPGGGHGEPVTSWWSAGAARQGRKSDFGGAPKLVEPSTAAPEDALPPMAYDLIHLVHCTQLPELFRRVGDHNLAYTGPAPCPTQYPPVPPSVAS